VLVEEHAPVQAPIEPALVQEAPPRIGFSNAQAVGVALFAWVLTFLLSVIASILRLPQVLSVLWLPAGGFISVLLYRRRTGQRLTVRNGARLGWICGLFGFIMAILALAALVMGLSDPSVASNLERQLEANGIPAATVSQMLDVFRSPSGIAGIVLTFFVMFSLLPAFGGALGAKLLNRGGSPQGR
jgi:hypothetical protein